MRVLLAALVTALALTAGRAPLAQPLVADLSDHLIAINTGFTGAEVVLFGAVDGPGDIAVVVRGPGQDVMVRRKEQTAGLWINRQSLAFNQVPGFYWLGSNRPVEDFARVTALDTHQIGLAHLRLEPATAQTAGEAIDPAELAQFRQALIRGRQREAIFFDGAPVTFLGDRLFRTTVSFPAEVPTGQYQVSVFLFRDGQVVAAQTTPLIILKTGIGARIFGFAQDFAAAYGLLAIAVAVFAGWLASAAFRRGGG